MKTDALFLVYAVLVSLPVKSYAQVLLSYYLIFFHFQPDAAYKSAACKKGVYINTAAVSVLHKLL